MEPRHAILFEPVRIGPKTLPNRFYQVPHATGFGSIKPRTQAAFRGMKAEGGWGGVCVEYAPVSTDSEESPAVAAEIWDDLDVANLRLTADAVHAHGSLAGIELFHGGAVSVNGASRATRIAPSATGAEIIWGAGAREMSVDDISRVQRDFVTAAKRARDAGYDIVYVYGAHGYLLTQFLSSATNQRTDGYGGSLANRARFHIETVEAVREAVGQDCAIATRMCIDGRDSLPGVHVEEMLEVVSMLDPIVDLFDVNVGAWPEDSGTSRYYPEGHQRPWILRVREATGKAIVGVGRYTSPDLMASIVRSGAVDLIGAARPAIADPFLPRKIAEGRYGDIRECTGSNVCILKEEQFAHVGCVQNPTAGEEYRRGWHPEDVPPIDRPDRSALVVGAGPAGMECALTLARRGLAAVHLVEAEAEIGGHLRWTRQLPTLGDWGRIIDWRAIQLDQHPKIEVITGRRLTAADVMDYGADIVVIATGSRWAGDGSQPATDAVISGAEHALTPEQVISGSRPAAGRPVVVYDAEGYYVGPGIAELLALEGYDVHLVTSHPVISPVSDGTLEGDFLRRHLHQAGVRMHAGVTLTDIDAQGARGETSLGEPWSLAESSVVLVTHRVSDDQLARELRDRGMTVHVVGDAMLPSMVSEAVFDGHRLAREIDGPHPDYPLAYLRERPGGVD
ncbi:MAG: FAD-dependent oxidoreductase [Candidatus Nanopelagicales bacterium]